MPVYKFMFSRLKDRFRENSLFFLLRAVSENRTHDLFPTKEVLYP
jgi:hypothetical protein